MPLRPRKPQQFFIKLFQSVETTETEPCLSGRPHGLSGIPDGRPGFGTNRPPDRGSVRPEKKFRFMLFHWKIAEYCRSTLWVRFFSRRPTQTDTDILTPPSAIAFSSYGRRLAEPKGSSLRELLNESASIEIFQVEMPFSQAYLLAFAGRACSYRTMEFFTRHFPKWTMKSTL